MSQRDHQVHTLPEHAHVLLRLFLPSIHPCRLLTNLNEPFMSDANSLKSWSLTTNEAVRVPCHFSECQYNLLAVQEGERLLTPLPGKRGSTYINGVISTLHTLTWPH